MNRPIVLAGLLGLWIFMLNLTASRANADDGKPIDVYLIGGQSNATGQGYLKNLPQDFKADTRVLLFHSGIPHLRSGAAPFTWIPLRQASESPDRFGPELGFGNEIQARTPGAAIALIKHAHSGTSLYRDWFPGSGPRDEKSRGPQYKIFVDTVNAGLEGLREKGFAPVIRGMIWQQGENDATSEAIGNSYGGNLSHFIARVREQFQTPDMLFVYGYVLPPPNLTPGRDAVRLGEKQVDQNSGNALAVHGAFVVATDDLSQRAADLNTPYPKDHLHFGTAGTLELGKRLADKMADALGATKPAATPPNP